MKRFWIEFANAKDAPTGMGWGCGVTAHTFEDALSIISENALQGRELPELKNFIEDVVVSDLDKNHVLPNIGNIFVRGIWFPLGFSME